MIFGLVLASLLLGALVYDAVDEDSDSSGETVDPDPITGTEGDDLLDGAAGNDQISGQDGDDIVNGNAGDDWLSGDAGDDTLNGGSGSDTLNGGTDRDILDGGAGDDILSGGAWGDILFGGDGDDTLNGDGGHDLLHGADGDDTLNGDNGDDILIGGDGTDTLNGGAGGDGLLGADILPLDLTLDDLVVLREINDLLTLDQNVQLDLSSDDSGADVLNGGEGNDFILLGEDDVATGGAGDDAFFAYEYPADSTGQSTITDYTGGEDQLVIIYPELETPPAISILDNANGDAIVSLDGVPTIILSQAAGTIVAGDIMLSGA